MLMPLVHDKVVKNGDISALTECLRSMIDELLMVTSLMRYIRQP